jgi:hypothetical protein
MPTPTYAFEVVTALKEAIANSPGVTEIQVDGMRAKIDVSQLDYWERRAAREESPRTRPISATIDLSGG